MNPIKEIKRAVYIAETNVLRSGCRFAARYYKEQGDLVAVKRYNDLAYKGDVLKEQIKKW